MSTNTKRPFGMRDKIGYMFGDFGNDFTFMLSSLFMMKFYTDVMGVNGGVVGILMMIAKIVDAVTDVTMGQIVDRSKPTKHGKFKPWLIRICGPVAIASFLIYQSGFAGMSYGFKVAWMAITYLLWGSIFYTAVNIPYGSMASAISEDVKDRAELSTWRNIGATLAQVVIGVGTPMFAYVTVNGNSVLSGSRMTIIAGVFSVCAVICYLICFNMVTERVEVPANDQKFDAVKMLKSVVTNRSLLGLIAAAIFLLLAQLSMSGLAAYVFPNYYSAAEGQSMATLLGCVVVLFICAPFASKIASKIGKKELSILSSTAGAALYLVCLILRPENVWVYVFFYASVTACIGFFNTVVWAMITDVIDEAELKNGVREDGTIYAVYSFARKLGQAFSSGLTGTILSVIGYTAATAYEPAVTLKLFQASCIVPAVGFVGVAIALVVIYPLGKDKVEANVAELKKRRG